MSRYLILLIVLLSSWLRAEPPQVFTIDPDAEVLNGPKHIVCPLRIITGANFDVPGLEVWTWQAPLAKNEAKMIERLSTTGRPTTGESDAEVEDLFGGGAGADPADPNVLPARPPTELTPVQPKKIEPTKVLSNAIVAAIDGGSIVWVKNRDGWSAPHLVGAAKPFWISDRQVRAGDYVHLFGHSVAREYLKGRVVLRGKERTTIVATCGSSRESLWYSDRFLEYIRVPQATIPGRYEVFAHNGYGGVYGWVYVGTLDVVEKNQPDRPVIHAPDQGTRGDGVADDSEALGRALQAAAKVGGELHLPVGIYRVTRTVTVPNGVTIRGNAGARTAISASGKWAGGGPIVSLGSDSGLLDITVEGPAREILMLRPASENIRVLGCTVGSDSNSPPDQVAIRGESCRYVRVGDCEITGPVRMTRADHVEIIKNRIRGSLELSGVNCLVDANVVDSGRLVLGALSRSLVRFNEIHAPRGDTAAARGDPLAAPELMVGRTLGKATVGGVSNLQDSAQKWTPGALKDAVVLVLSGTGFGQHRLVVGNTADTLTVDRPWTMPPDRSSIYLVGPMSLESAFSYSYVDCPEPQEIVNSVGCVFQYQRVIMASVDFRGVAGPGPNAFFPCWFNRLSASWLNQSRVNVMARDEANAPHSFPVTFGNAVAGNLVQRSGTLTGAHVQGELSVVSGNTFLLNDVGVAVESSASGALVLGNNFRFVNTPITDKGKGTMNTGNQLFDEVVEEELNNLLNMSASRWRPRTLEWKNPWTGEDAPGRPVGMPPVD